MQISAETFRLIAGSVGDNGIEFNGINIPINRENRRKILAAVQAARETSQTKAARQPKVATARKRIDGFFADVRAIAETSAQRAELIVLMDRARGELTNLIEEVGRATIIVR